MEYAERVTELQVAAHKAGLKDARRLLDEQQAAYTAAGTTSDDVPRLPESILRQITLDGGVAWPRWVYTELNNLGYESVNTSAAEKEHQQRVARLLSDATTIRARRWMRYESPTPTSTHAHKTVTQVQASTMSLLRRHATLVMSARGYAPIPPTTSVNDFAEAVERVAAWFRVYGFFDASVVNDQVVDVTAEGLVVSVGRPAPGYQMSPHDLNPLLGVSTNMDRLGALVLYDTDSVDSTVIDHADQHAVALFVLTAFGQMAPQNRTASALASRTGGDERVPWPYPSAHRT